MRRRRREWSRGHGRIRNRPNRRHAGGSRGGRARAPTIEFFLLPPSGVRAIVGRTPFRGTPTTVVPTAAKRTTQNPAPHVARIGQELNPAVSALLQTRPQSRMGSQNPLQLGPILTDERVGAVILVPIRPKRKNFFQSYDKKARLSVTMPSVLHTPSSYPPDAKAARRRPRFFMRQRQESRAATRTTDATTNRSAILLVYTINPAPPNGNSSMRYLK